MKRSVRSFAALAGLGLFGVVACTTEETVADLGDRCSLNSECKDPLVCGFERCRPECATSRDCGGRRCMRTAAGANVCQLEDEVSCTHNSQCPGTQVCAADLQCRDQCVSDKDCVGGQQCTDSVCAETTELGPGGVLPARVPTEGVRCTYATECPGDLVCLNGVCAIECYNDRDCYVTWQCNTVALGGDGRCYPPGKVPPTDGGAGDGGPTDGGSDGGPSDGGDGGTQLPITRFALSAGCAVLQDGRVKCWDYSEDLWGPMENALPELVPGLENVRSIVGTQEQRFALLNDGTAWTFGRNARNPLMSYESEPEQLRAWDGNSELSPLERIKAISPGPYEGEALIVFEDLPGTYIWNHGDGGLLYRDEEGRTAMLGYRHAFLEDGDIVEYTSDNGYDLKGLNGVLDATPIAFVTGGPGHAIVEGRESACAIVSEINEKRLLCWGGGLDPNNCNECNCGGCGGDGDCDDCCEGCGGFSSYGVFLGQNEPVFDQPEPTAAHISDPQQIVANAIRVAVLTADNEVWTWCPIPSELCPDGAPHFEQIGDGGEFRVAKLAPMGPLGSRDGYFDPELEPLCAITPAGELYCARYNEQFQQVQGVANVIDAAVTMGRVYIVTADGALKVWNAATGEPPEDIPL